MASGHEDRGEILGTSVQHRSSADPTSRAVDIVHSSHATGFRRPGGKAGRVLDAATAEQFVVFGDVLVDVGDRRDLRRGPGIARRLVEFQPDRLAVDRRGPPGGLFPLVPDAGEERIGSKGGLATGLIDPQLHPTELAAQLDAKALGIGRGQLEPQDRSRGRPRLPG